MIAFTEHECQIWKEKLCFNAVGSSYKERRRAVDFLIVLLDEFKVTWDGET